MRICPLVAASSDGDMQLSGSKKSMPPDTLLGTCTPDTVVGEQQ